MDGPHRFIEPVLQPRRGDWGQVIIQESKKIGERLQKNRLNFSEFLKIPNLDFEKAPNRIRLRRSSQKRPDPGSEKSPAPGASSKKSFFLAVAPCGFPVPMGRRTTPKRTRGPQVPWTCTTTATTMVKCNMAKPSGIWWRHWWSAMPSGAGEVRTNSGGNQEMNTIRGINNIINTKQYMAERRRRMKTLRRRRNAMAKVRFFGGMGIFNFEIYSGFFAQNFPDLIFVKGAMFNFSFFRKFHCIF